MLLQKYLCIGKHFLNLVVYNREEPFGGYLKNILQGTKLTFYTRSHFAPKHFKVVANSKTLGAMFYWSGKLQSHSLL